MDKVVPTWRDRQKQLFNKDSRFTTAQLSEIGQQCLDAGHIQSALLYFSKAKDDGGLQKLEGLALDEGDAFLLLALEKNAGAEKHSDLWNRLGYRAFELGKYRFAQQAFERTQNELMLAKIRAQIEPETNVGDSA